MRGLLPKEYVMLKHLATCPHLHDAGFLRIISPEEFETIIQLIEAQRVSMIEFVAMQSISGIDYGQLAQTPVITKSGKQALRVHELTPEHLR